MIKTLILRVVRVESRYKKFFVRMVTGRALELLRYTAHGGTLVLPWDGDG